MALPATYTTGQRIWHWVLWAIVVAILLFLVLPVLVIVPLSFSAGSFLTFPLPGLSFQWRPTAGKKRGGWARPL